MVSKNLFSSHTGRMKTSKHTPSKAEPTNTVNTAGGRAYNTEAKHTLAQIACTGTFNGTFYADGLHTLTLAEESIEALWEDPEYIAKVAVYARDRGFMKDLPAYIVAKLADVDKRLFRLAFRKVVDNGKMLRNVIQIARSGRLNKRYNMSAGMWRHALRDWFAERNPYQLFKAAIGNDPSMADIIKMAHPRPNSDEKAALFRYFIGKPVALETLPEPVRSYELYRKGIDRSEIPDVDFRYLSDLGLGKEEWKQIARNAPWTMTRMNLNTFHRHGVLEDQEMVQIIADRLRDKSQIEKTKVFPYQLFMAYKATKGNMPFEITEALQDAMEISVANAPVFQGQTHVAIDVSGSMSWGSITGNRGTASSKVRPVDVAALFSAAVLRNNRSTKVYPFDTYVHELDLNGRDSVLTNAEKLSIQGGGTDCSVVLNHLNSINAKGDAVVYISDNESWVDRSSYSYVRCGTGMMKEWVIYKKRNPAARLVLIDTSPSNNSQVTHHDDILQVGGFSDNVFKVVDTFLQYGHDTDHWVSEISKTSLE